ncbi:cartilage matrix protein, partial [Biomphalaria glabrata]
DIKMMKYFAVLCLLCVLPKSSHQDTSCRRQMDLVFVIDGSNSLGEYNFNLVLQNVSKAVEETLTIGPNDTRVGVVVYSKTVTAVIQLQTNSSQFKSEILQIDYPDQTTATDLGIKKAVEILLSQRRNVPMTMMIITDGVSDNRFNTESEARTAKLQGIDIWVVGVGKGLDVDELNSIASNGANQTFFIKDFKDFGLQLQNVTIVTCVNTKIPVCRRPIDLVFVIDGSNSLGEYNFNLIIQTVSNAVNSLVVGPNDTRIGAVLYSRTVTNFIPLQTNAKLFIDYILQFEYPDETTATDLGITKAVELLTSQKRNVPMTMIIITDGESDNRTKTKQEAEAAKSKGINIWGAGVGKGLDMTELDNLATNGAQQTAFIEDFKEFSIQLENLTSTACNKIEVPVCRRPIDLVFVIDGSNSLGEDNFNLIIKTVSESVNSLVIGPNDTRVGAVLYSRTVTSFIQLVTDVDAFKKAILGFQYPDETTATDLGIEKAVDLLTSQKRNVPMTMIIITDGESDNRTKTKLQAESAKSKGINIWGVGVGKGLDMTELDNLATNGAQQTVFIGDFQEFAVQLENLTSAACNKIEVPVCSRPIDLVFVIDGSNSLGEDNFNLIIRTVSEAVNSLAIGPNDTRVGAVLYSRTVTNFIELVADVDVFKKAILGFQYPDETTATFLGIAKAVELLTSQKRNVPMAMMIITDGESNNRTLTKQEAEAAKSKGINIWGVGVGKGLDMTELDNLATNGAQQTVFIEDFNQFTAQFENLTSSACNKIETSVCRSPMDLMFVIDGSNSLGEDNFNRILSTVST